MFPDRLDAHEIISDLFQRPSQQTTSDFGSGAARTAA
jgi:hypothetical protein